jgi:hypothetical protein
MTLAVESGLLILLLISDWLGDVSFTAQQSLAADGAIAFFSSNLFLRGLNADCAPQLKAVVGWLSFPDTIFYDQHRIIIFAVPASYLCALRIGGGGRFNHRSWRLVVDCIVEGFPEPAALIGCRV